MITKQGVDLAQANSPSSAAQPIGRYLIPLSILTTALIWPFFVITFPSVPRSLVYVPDAVIAVACIFLVPRIIASNAWSSVPLGYILVFLGFTYVCIAGVVLNAVSGDTIFAGFRMYFRYAPIFLIPFAYLIDERTLRVQLGWLVGILLLQVPITLLQRFVLQEGVITGDNIRGTLTSTSSLAVLCPALVAMVLAFTLDKRIKPFTAGILTIAFIFPAALSETKATPIFLVVACSAVIIAKWRQITAQQLFVTIGIGVTTLVLFVGMYDVLYKAEGDRGYFDIMTDSNMVLDSYTFKGVKALPISIPRKERGHLIAEEKPKTDLASERQLGRFDSISMPFYSLYPNEIPYLALGLGIGNVTTDFGSGGDYLAVEHVMHASHVTLSNLVWETGVCGALMFAICIVMVFVRNAQPNNGLTGIYATTSTGVAAYALVCVAALFYANLFHLPEITLLFFYMAGLMAARVVQERKRSAVKTMESASLLVSNYHADDSISAR